MDIKAPILYQLAEYISANPNTDILVITQDKVFKDALNRILNANLDENNWVRKSVGILTLSQWYQMLWSKIRLRRILNNGDQLPEIIDSTSETILWRNLVAQWAGGGKDWTEGKTEGKARPLLNANGAADSMHKNWKLLVKSNFISCSHTACLEADELKKYIEKATTQCKVFLNCLLNGNARDNGELQPDHLAFLEIAARYREHMNRENAVSVHLLPNAISKILLEEDIKITLPQEIVLANFPKPVSPLCGVSDSPLGQLPNLQLREFFKVFSDRYGCSVTKRGEPGQGCSDKADAEGTKITLWSFPDKVNSDCHITLFTKKPANEESAQKSGPAAQPLSPFESFEEELVFAAQQAREVLKNDKQSRAAVVIPGLRGRVSEITLILDKALSPETLIGGNENADRSYFLISGEKILKHPLIQDILNLLRLSMSTLSRQKLINIISDSFLKTTKPALTAKAELCKELRRDFHSIYTLEDFKHAVEEYNAPNSQKDGKAENTQSSDRHPSKQPKLANLKDRIYKITELKKELLDLDAGVSYSEACKKTLPLSAWAEYANRLINECFNLEKVSKASKTADNAVGALIKVLYKLVRVSARHYQKRVNFSDFMQYLRLLLIDRENSFYYRQDTAGLRVLDVKQALGSHFTHLYLIQFNDSNFPAPAASQGFIPAEVLALLGSENANAKQALGAARRRIYGLTQVCDHLFLSFSNTLEKSGSLLPSAVSPLYREVMDMVGGKEEKEADAPDKKSYDPGFIGRQEGILENIDEEPVPKARPNKLITDENGVEHPGFRGGTGLINAMCNCPFKAFLTYRLRCEDDCQINDGLSSLDRGSIIHKIMENTWKKLNEERQGIPAKEYLKNVGATELERIIDEQINNVLSREHADIAIFKQNDDENILKKNEEERLRKILYYWFENHERNWNSFEVRDDNLEKEIVFSVNGFFFNGRADRIDILKPPVGAASKQTTAIIDYKSGASSAKIDSWGIERKEEEEDKKTSDVSQPETSDVKSDSVDFPLQSGKNYQLPVYAAFGNLNCSDICFGKLTLKESESGFKTFNEDVHELDKKRQNQFLLCWDEQKKAWKDMIEQRIEEFVNGKDGNLIPRANPTGKNCLYCHLTAVCPYKDADANEDEEENSNA